MNVNPPVGSDKLSNNLSRMLLGLARDFEKRSLEKCHERGYSQIRPSHFSVFSNIGTGTIRLTELAERAGITQQAMGKLVKELEDEGYIVRRIDETDKRARLIELTEIGHRFVADNIEIVEEILEEYRQVMGKEGIDNLNTILRHSTSALSLP